MKHVRAAALLPHHLVLHASKQSREAEQVCVSVCASVWACVSECVLVHKST